MIFTAHPRASANHPGGEGEGYLASSADLMIGILFIFIIMVVYLAVEIKRVESENSLAADPLKALVTTLGEKLRASGVRVELDPDSGVLALPADALFDKGESVPRLEAVGSIARTNEILSEVVPCYVQSGVSDHENCAELNRLGVQLETIMVEGHTDSDQYANDPNKNWHLGLDRARYIFNVFERGMLGSLRNAKDQPLLGVSSYADTRPVSNAAMQGADGPERKAMNRRVELRFILSYQGSGVAGGAAQMLDRMKGR